MIKEICNLEKQVLECLNNYNDILDIKKRVYEREIAEKSKELEELQEKNNELREKIADLERLPILEKSIDRLKDRLVELDDINEIEMVNDLIRECYSEYGEIMWKHKLLKRWL